MAHPITQLTVERNASLSLEIMRKNLLLYRELSEDADRRELGEQAVR